MRSIIRYISLIGALSVTDAFYFYVNSKTLSCAGNPFTEIIITHQCVEPAFYGEEQFYGPNCFWGDHIFITGSVIAVSNFPSNGQVVVIPEFLNWQKYNIEDMQSVGTVCQALVPLEGQTCGEPGGYGMKLEMDLPTKSESWYQTLLDSVTSITFHFTNSFDCDEVVTSRNLALPQEASGIGLGVAFGALFAVWNGKRRRSNRQQSEDASDSDGEDQEEMARYVELCEQPRRKSTQAAAEDPVVQWRKSDSVVDAMEQHRVIYGE